MIIVTNGTEVIKINKQYLLKTNEGYYIKPEFDYWMINLIVILENGIISKIIKILPKGDEILDEFNNLEQSSKEIMLAEDDFLRFKKLYNNMRIKKNLRKKAIIEAIAQILSFEYYQTKILEDCNVSIDDIFEYEMPNIYNYKEYRDEIFKRANEILKKEYL